MSLHRLAVALGPHIPRRMFISLQYRRHFGRWPNLRNPLTFNEKLQWLKLHYRHPSLQQCADKYEVRAYVARNTGDHVLNRLLGVFDSPDEIHIDRLPESFVIKATHGSGWNLICRNKCDVDWAEARGRMRYWLAQDYYAHGCEWAYRGLRPRLICEAFMEDVDGRVPKDYKFFCFNGEPAIVQVDHDRFENHTRSLYDKHWTLLPWTLKYPSHFTPIDPPSNLANMLSLARVLSAGFPFVRVDLYALRGRTVFGEMTFYPGGGLERFGPDEADRELGALLKLPTASEVQK